MLTDAYSLDEAIADGVLVPPKAVSVPLKIVRAGLRYDDLTEEEKEHWDSLEWGEDEVPDSVDAAEVNKRLFNEDTVDLVIAHLMQNGQKVEGGDRLGKTIIFAKNQAHALFIEKRFNAAWPNLAGHFARVITYESGPYSNFADEIGDGVEHELPQIGEADFARFKQKARHFLKAHEGHIVLHKLRQGKALTASDLNELEKMLLDAGIGEAGDIARAREASQGFGRFVRSLVGLDRAAVQEAFGEFLAVGTASAAQIEFIEMVVEHLTDQGMLDPALLYEPPFTDIAPTGPDRLFDDEKVTRLFTKIKALNESAVA